MSEPAHALLKGEALCALARQRSEQPLGATLGATLVLLSLELSTETGGGSSCGGCPSGCVTGRGSPALLLRA